jgi:GNAT superfamily N-acetyltransferase
MQPRLDSSIVIRGVKPSDFMAWKALWDGYNKFYGRSGATALPLEITQTTWSRFFDSAEPVHALVAEKSGQLLGLVHYLFHRSTIQIVPTCYLQDLFTIEEARGIGVGQTLIEAVYEKAKINGCPRVYWQTHETNTIARRLYDSAAENSGFLVYRKVF